MSEDQKPEDWLKAAPVMAVIDEIRARIETIEARIEALEGRGRMHPTGISAEPNDFPDDPAA